jgi:anti-anti-sigma regulatory factor
LTKVRDDNGKLVKTMGNLGKMVVIYSPLPKIRETLKRSGLSEFLKTVPNGDNVEESAPVQT